MKDHSSFTQLNLDRRGWTGVMGWSYTNLVKPGEDIYNGLDQSFERLYISIEVGMRMRNRGGCDDFWAIFSAVLSGK